MQLHDKLHIVAAVMMFGGIAGIFVASEAGRDGFVVLSGATTVLGAMLELLLPQRHH